MLAQSKGGSWEVCTVISQSPLDLPVDLYLLSVVAHCTSTVATEFLVFLELQ